MICPRLPPGVRAFFQKSECLLRRARHGLRGCEKKEMRYTSALPGIYWTFGCPCEAMPLFASGAASLPRGGGSTKIARLNHIHFCRKKAIKTKKAGNIPCPKNRTLSSARFPFSDSGERKFGHKGGQPFQESTNSSVPSCGSVKTTKVERGVALFDTPMRRSLRTKQQFQQILQIQISLHFIDLYLHLFYLQNTFFFAFYQSPPNYPICKKQLDRNGRAPLDNLV